MSSKRRKLTGGTGDLKPQIFTLSTGNQPALNTYAVTRSPLPVPRFGTQRAKATIFEMLRVDLYFGLTEVADVINTMWCYLTTSTQRTSGLGSTIGTMVADIQDPKTFAFGVTETGALGAGGSSRFGFPVSIDLTDGAGNGILVATDNINIVYGSSDNSAIASGQAKIYYRMVNVGVQEYVGIVQSQQL